MFGVVFIEFFLFVFVEDIRRLASEFIVVEDEMVNAIIRGFFGKFVQVAFSPS